MRIEFAYLFRLIGEGDAYAPAVITFGRIPYEETTYGDKKVITKYRYLLVINLWLLLFHFKWTL